MRYLIAVTRVRPVLRPSRCYLLDFGSGTYCRSFFSCNAISDNINLATLMHTTDDDVPLVWRAEQHISKWSSARSVQTGRHSTSGHKTRSV